jgi:hypothetical protein
MRTLTLILPNGKKGFLFEACADRLVTFKRSRYGRPLRDNIDRHLSCLGLLSCRRKHKGRFVWQRNELGDLVHSLFTAFAA